MKYCNEKCLTYPQISFKLIDSKNVVLNDYPGHGCCASVFNSISKKTHQLVVYQDKTFIPYGDESIIRWVTDINEMGFPCSLVNGEKKITVTFNISDYQYKAHLFSGFTLLRTLWDQQGLCQVIESYFQAMDKEPGADKFDVMQTAHKLNKCASSHRSITYNGNGHNVTREDFVNKCVQQGLETLQVGNPFLNLKWHGKTWNGKPPYPDCLECSNEMRR